MRRHDAYRRRDRRRTHHVPGAARRAIRRAATRADTRADVRDDDRSDLASRLRHPASRRAGGGDRGQATAELAMVLPFVALLILGLVHVGELVSDYIMATHAAREGARAAAVDSDPGAAERAARAAGGLDPRHLRVETRNRGGVGDRVRVTVRYRSTNPIPFLRWLLDDVGLTTEATMRVER